MREKMDKRLYKTELKIWNTYNYKLSMIKTAVVIILISLCMGRVSAAIEMCPDGCSCNLIKESEIIINCTYMSTNEIPYNIPEKVTELHLHYSNLGEITPESLPYLPNLKKLTLNHCQLSGVEFMNSNLPSLKVLDLSHNQLVGLPDTLPQSIESLVLSYNDFNAFISCDLLVTLTHLRELYLDYNKMENLDHRTLDADKTPKIVTFPTIHNLVLSDNNIRSIGTNFFKTFSYLETLNLSNNKLQTLQDHSLTGLSMLQEIDLSQNIINAIDDKALIEFNNLKYLNLQHNRISKVPYNLPMLQWLDLSYNRFETISEDFKSVFYPIEVLNIAQNPLYCDCRIAWLKDLYDRREYIIKHLKIKASEFIPHCAGPESLSGETWDLLSEDLFVCTASSINSVGSQNDDAFVASDLEVESSHISDTFIKVLWNLKAKVPFKNVFIQYYKFGDRAGTIKHVELSVLQKEYTLKHLQPEVNYVLCIIPKLREKDEIETVQPLTFSHCLEVTTLAEKTTPIGSYFMIFCYYMIGMAGTIIFLITAIGVAALACSVLVPKDDWSAKYVIDEPILDEKPKTNSKVTENGDCNAKGGNGKIKNNIANDSEFKSSVFKEIISDIKGNDRKLFFNKKMQENLKSFIPTPKLDRDGMVNIDEPIGEEELLEDEETKDNGIDKDEDKDCCEMKREKGPNEDLSPKFWFSVKGGVGDEGDHLGADVRNRMPEGATEVDDAAKSGEVAVMSIKKDN